MTTARAALLEKMIADRTAGSVIKVMSRSNPFVDYAVDVERNRCSCPARRGTCWHLKLARVSLRYGVSVTELLYRLRRAKDLGGCGAESCLWCCGIRTRFYCPGSEQGRAAWSRMVINSEIERTI